MATDFIATQTLNGLGTFALFTAPSTQSYFINGQITLPTLVDGGGVSAVVVTVKRGSTTVYTGDAGATGFQLNLPCTGADAVTCVLTSSAAPDQALNVIKGVVSISVAF